IWFSLAKKGNIPYKFKYLSRMESLKSNVLEQGGQLFGPTGTASFRLPQK
ncbi:MAG: hypothetical protein RLZ05_1214, partial [Bacteroidota bacterium]